MQNPDRVLIGSRQTASGSKFLNASIGFGGFCFKKDILNLVYICRHYGLHEVADYWQGVVKINIYQQERFVLNMLENMFNTLAGKKVCLFGFAFKANTGDTRESPAFYTARQLAVEQAEIIITDPKAMENAKRDLQDIQGKIEYIADPYEAVMGCDVIAVMTEWDLYKGLDYQKIFQSMRQQPFVFDGRNILDHQKLFEISFNVFPIGKMPLTNFVYA